MSNSGHIVSPPLANRPVPLHAQAMPIGLQVSYNGRNDQIKPGECYRFTAQDVQLTPAHPLQPGRVLDLTVESLSGNGSTQMTANDHGAHNRSANAETAKDLAQNSSAGQNGAAQANPGQTGTPE